jgi:hypothetical protein
VETVRGLGVRMENVEPVNLNDQDPNCGNFRIE